MSITDVKVIGDYTAAVAIDGTTHFLLIQPGNSSTAYKKISRNVLLGITGAPVGDTDSQTLTNKTLGNTNTITLKDTLFTLQDDGDTTKQARFQLSGITTATTRTYTLPNASSTLVDLTTTQTLSGKTLTSPIINGGTIDNSTVTVDTIAGHTVAGNGTVYGLAINSGVLQTANSVKTSNIQNLAITTATVNTDAITDAKLIYGKVRSRLGGSATNWTTAGTTTYDYSATDVFWQVGTNLANASPTTITFPTAFNQVPIVNATLLTAVGVNCYIAIVAPTATNFTVQVVTDAGVANTAQTIMWTAVGQ